jgi:predicted AlkP superfamily phosphohydrolase/phosphomutase
MSSPRLVLIGMDAASNPLIRKWAAVGELPAIASLIKSGFSATVATPLAVLEGGIWPTFLTSMSPARHGMFSHFNLKRATFAGHRTGDHFADGLLVGRGVGFDRARLTELVRTQDIGPTVLDFFGVQAPASCEGQSVMQLLKAHS